MATVPVASVAVLVRPIAKGFKTELNKQLNTAGLAATGREISEEITEPLQKDAKDAGKKAHESIAKEVGKPVKQKLSLGKRFKAAGKKAGQQFKANFKRMIKGGLLLAGTAIGAGGFMFLKDATAEASNLEQSLGGLEAVFKENSDVMKQFSADAASELGLSRNEYNELATLMGTQMKAGGLDGTELTNGVQEMMTLGSDLGSLFGTTTSEASAAISSAFRGEYEPLRAYGITLSETAIEAEALEMGLIKEGEALDAASKQAATQSLIMEQSADAHGNFGRESDTLANKQQKAAAQFANVKATVGEMLLPALTGLMDVVIEKVLPGFESLVGWVKDNLIPAFQTFGDWVQKNSAWLAPLGVALGVVAVAIGAIAAAKAIWSGVTKGLAAAQAFLNTTLLASPITWIVIGIIALVAALILAYKKSETFRNIVNGVWVSIKSAIGTVVDWIVTYVWPVIKTAWDGIAAGAIWLYQNVILPVWNGIRTAIGAVAGWIMNTLVPWLQSAWTMISNAMLWLYNTIILPVWDAIRIAIAIAVGIIMTYVDLLKFYFNNVLAPVFLFLYNNVVLPVWNGIKAAISAVVAWFRDTAWPILSAVINWIRTKFEQFKIGLGIIWNFIMNNVIKPVITWFQTVVWPIISKVIDWIKNKFELWKQGMKIIWDYVMNNVIKPVINWFRDVVWPLIGRVIDLIKEKFENFKNNLKRIWNFVRYVVIQPVVDWLMDNVVGRISTFIDKVKEGFEGLKTSIGEIWDQIKDVIRDPVEWIIDTILNDGIIDNINSVLSTFGMEDKHIGAVSLPSGFATGGYTGPGSKYQPAGVVHADEYVIRKESQRSLRNAAPGFLDSLNKYGAGALGYASGGLVSLGPAFTGSGSRGDGYGARGGKHKGIDWALPHGTALIATADGTAAQSYNSAAGNKLTLSHGNGVATTYHHLSGYAVPTGARVSKGQVIGYVGSTGRSSGPQLHMGVQKDGTYVNPDPYLTGGGEAGSGGMWNPFAGLWDSLKAKVSEKVGDSVFGQMLGGMPKYLIDQGKNWFTDQVAAIGDFASDVGGATRWSAVASEALLRENQFGPKRLASLLRRMGQESGYDPSAINNWDVNAKNGTPSKGLMQVIQPTFDAYRDASLGNDIWDPLQNIVASIRYTLDRYGNLETGWDRAGGYAEGGLVRPLLHDQGGYLQPGLSVIENRTRKPEYILNQKQWDAVYESRNQDGRDITLNQYINSTNATAEAVASGVTWELKRKGITGR